MKTFKLQVNSAKVSGTHSDFPAYVDLSEMPTAFWDTVSNGGGDIRCYSNEALTTELPREVVSCDTSTKTGELHVKTGMSTTTTIYIKVDGTSSDYAVTATYGRNNVWSDYVEEVNFDYYNTGNLNGQDNWSGPTDYQVVNTFSRLGNKTVKFPTTNNKVISRSFSSKSRISLSSWIYYTENNVNRLALGLKSGSTQLCDIRWSSSNGAIALRASNTSYVLSTELKNGWFRAEVEADSSTNKVRAKINNNDWSQWYNAISSSTFSNIDAVRFSTYDDYTKSGDVYWDGIRILEKTNSDDWITTEYNNQSDASTFWTITEVGTTNTSNFFQLF